MRMLERLEVRAVPGSMLAEVAALAGKPWTGVQLAAAAARSMTPAEFAPTPYSDVAQAPPPDGRAARFADGTAA